MNKIIVEIIIPRKRKKVPFGFGFPNKKDEERKKNEEVLKRAGF